MAMNVGSTQNKFGGDDEFETPIVAEINITPLTDIFLVLLIIFMVTSSVMTQMGIQVQLPNSNRAAQEQTGKPSVLVTVNEAGQVFVNGTETGLDQMGLAMKRLLDVSADKTVVVEGDRKAVLGTIVRVMDEGKKAGATKFAVATKAGGD